MTEDALAALIGIPIGVAMLSAALLYIANPHWLELSKPNRYILYPLWFAILLVVGVVAFVPALAVKVCLPRGYGQQEELED